MKRQVALLGAATIVIFAAGVSTFHGVQGDAATRMNKIEPQKLLRKLAAPNEQRPAILCVGFRTLYNGGHIPGAIFAGPAATAEGSARLKEQAGAIARDKEVVIYCGCCPFDKCPNIVPANAALRAMGFKRVEVLSLPRDFAHDWVEKNLPFDRGK